jgi:hypothetical protein
MAVRNCKELGENL